MDTIDIFMLYRIINKIRGLYWSRKFGSTKEKIHFGKKNTFQHPECLHFGKNIGIGKYTYFLPWQNLRE